jgi:hypothetical protein
MVSMAGMDRTRDVYDRRTLVPPFLVPETHLTLYLSHPPSTTLRIVLLKQESSGINGYLLCCNLCGVRSSTGNHIDGDERCASHLPEMLGLTQIGIISELPPSSRSARLRPNRCSQSPIRLLDTHDSFREFTLWNGAVSRFSRRLRWWSTLSFWSTSSRRTC